MWPKTPVPGLVQFTSGSKRVSFHEPKNFANKVMFARCHFNRGPSRIDQEARAPVARNVANSAAKDERRSPSAHQGRGRIKRWGGAQQCVPTIFKRNPWLQRPPPLQRKVSPPQIYGPRPPHVRRPMDQILCRGLRVELPHGVPLPCPWLGCTCPWCPGCQLGPGKRGCWQNKGRPRLMQWGQQALLESPLRIHLLIDFFSPFELDFLNLLKHLSSLSLFVGDSMPFWICTMTSTSLSILSISWRSAPWFRGGLSGWWCWFWALGLQPGERP